MISGKPVKSSIERTAMPASESSEAVPPVDIPLDGLPEYPRVAERFRPGALVPYTYGGRVYALPLEGGIFQGDF